MSQREVERGTDKVVSNAYLSEVENDQIKRPSPNILNALAELHGVPYEDLMERAGFVVPRRAPRSPQQPFAEHNLTSAEEAKLIGFLGYLRSRKKPGGAD